MMLKKCFDWEEVFFGQREKLFQKDSLTKDLAIMKKKGEIKVKSRQQNSSLSHHPLIMDPSIDLLTVEPSIRYVKEEGGGGKIYAHPRWKKILILASSK